MGNGSATGITVAGVQAVFTIVASEQIAIECLSVTAAEGEVGILMDQIAKAQGNRFELMSPDTDILIGDLDLSASTRRRSPRDTP